MVEYHQTMDIEREFCSMAAELHAEMKHDDEPEMVPIDWRVAAFYATYLTATGIAYYYIGRAIRRSIRRSLT